MAIYTIIGGDQKPYSSVTPEDIRRWIADGRLNAQSLAREENDTEWRTLSAFPEFADALAGGSAPPPLTSPPAAPDDRRDAALRMVKGPAIGLMATAIFNLILALWSLIRLMFSPLDMQQFNSALQQLNNPQLQEFMQKLFHTINGPIGMANILFELAVSALILIGAVKMQSLRSHGFALAAAILSVVPCLTPCCGYVIGLAFGIWALVVLNKPEVKSQFT
jgi:hypothetical protein